MKILFFGDVFGESGRRALRDNLKTIVKENMIDFVIINGENVSHGKSLDENHYHELGGLGVNAFTMGNHTFYGGKLEKYIKRAPDVIIPANYSAYNEYEGTQEFKVNGKTLRVTSILGRSFMQPIPENPFKAIDKILKNSTSDVHIVDFHAEASSESVCFGNYLDGKVSAVLGTHTHIQTADERILPKGTAYITDVGMNGCIDSAIGADYANVTGRMRTNKPLRFELAEGKYVMCAVIVEIDDETNETVSIKRLRKVES